MDEIRPNRPQLYENLDPAPRLLMGPGPVDVHPRILRALSMPMLGQFDPQFTGYMNQVMDLLRQVFRTENRWAFLSFPSPPRGTTRTPAGSGRSACR